MKLAKILNIVAVIAILLATTPFIPGLFYIALVQFTGVAEDQSFREISAQGVREADEILIKHQICDSVELCRTKEIIVTNGIESGFSVLINGIVDAGILAELSTIFIQKFQSHKDIKRVKIVAFPFSLREYNNLHFWQYFPPWRNKLEVLSVNMERGV